MGQVHVRHRTRPAVSVAESKVAPITKSTDPTLAWVERLDLSVVYRSIAELRPYKNNARTHSKSQIAKIGSSIRQFGFVNPILVDARGEIVAGHGRLAAALELGLSRVPVLQLDHLTDEQKRAYRIADNRLAELAGWDETVLAIELKELLEIDTTFDIEVTGFEVGQIDVLLGDEPSDAPDPADEIETPQGPAVTRLGDLWQLGPHRLLCADAREKSSYETLLAGELAQLVVTDPPFNVRMKGHATGLGKVQHREFVMGSGEMAEAEFAAFLKTVLGNLSDASTDGAISFVFMDWRHLEEVLAAGRAVYSELKNFIVWAKDNAGMGSFYRSQHELVLAFKKGTAPHINNFKLGETGRHRSNVWRYAGCNTFARGRDELLAMHPTVKPVAMIADAILDCSKRHGIVLDAFGGSGTTIMAAERTGRRGYLLELDPLYVDVTIRRWEKYFREPARHVETGLTFAELAAQRAGVGEVGHDR